MGKDYDPAKRITLYLSTKINMGRTITDLSTKSVLNPGHLCGKEYFVFYLPQILDFFVLSMTAYGKVKIVLDLYLHSCRFLMTKSSVMGT